MKDIVSVLLYLSTFLFGFFFEGIKGISDKNRTYYLKCFVIWLFIFLCFSYMNGADWRGYELDYNSGGQESLEKDLGYYYIIRTCWYFIKDFWITFALLKCLYLWSCIKLLKALTPRWVPSLAIMIPTMLLFMLVNSPFRFMIAMICVNGAFFCTWKAVNSSASSRTRKNKVRNNTSLVTSANSKKKRTFSIKRHHIYYLFALVFCIIAYTIHSAALFTVVFVPFIKFHPFCKINSLILIGLYIGLAVLSSNLNNVILVQLFLDTLFRDNGMRSYNAYFADETGSFFTLGVFLQFMIFLLVLFTRDKMIKRMPNGELISNMTILSCLVWRVVAVMPTASRVVYPLMLFYSIYFVYLAKSSRIVEWLVLCYFCVSMTNNLYYSFKLIIKIKLFIRKIIK